MTKKKTVIANWKMNPEKYKEAEKLLVSVLKPFPRFKKTNVIICPPAIYLQRLEKISKKVSFGGQNMFWLEKGAQTGEISPSMLVDAKAKYVIIGHSERRAMGETNEDINKKLKLSLSFGLIPIVCIGESDRDENHEYFNIVKSQIEECLFGLSRQSLSKIMIAYEPVWAISTTPNHRFATPADSKEMSIFIQKVISDTFGVSGSSLPTVLYGGSVDERDVGSFLEDGGIEGVLVGGASLKPEKFTEIIKICEALKN